MWIDYRLLLLKYINHVSDCEGVDFIEDCNTSYKSEVVFTDDEMSELKRLSQFIVSTRQNPDHPHRDIKVFDQ